MILGKLLETTLTACGLLDLRQPATGGSTTTVQDTALLNKKGTNFYKDRILVVSKTTNGAAPQGQFGIVSAYSAANPPTFTVPTMTQTAHSGDIYAVMKNTIALYEAIEQINIAMDMLPAVRLEDTSLTASASTLEYTLPIATKGYPIQDVLIGNSTNGWKQKRDYKIRPAVGGSTETLVFQTQPPYDTNTPANGTIRLIYLGKQTALSAFSDTISEKYADELVNAVCAFQMIEYYINKKTLHNNKGWMGRHAFLQQRYQLALQNNPVRTPPGVSPRTVVLGNMP